MRRTGEIGVCRGPERVLGADAHDLVSLADLHALRSTTLRRPVEQEPADSRFDRCTAKRIAGSRARLSRTMRFRAPFIRSMTESNKTSAAYSLLHLGEHWLLFIASGSSLTCNPKYTVGDVVRPTNSAFERSAVSSIRRSLPATPNCHSMA